jgi:hypothetical protein
VNTDELETTLSNVDGRVLETQTTTHRPARDDPHRRLGARTAQGWTGRTR